jgi:outer membrane protein assembly factor BamB
VATASPVRANAAFPANPLWTAMLRGSLSYPLMADGKIFVLALPWDSNGDSRLRLHARDAATGADAWQGPVILSDFHRAGQFALEGQTLVVVTGDCVAVGIDTRTGSRLWTVALAQTLPNVWSCDAPPTVKNGIAYLSMSGVAVTAAAIDVADGSVLWSRRVSLAGGAPPTVTDDAVYLGSYLQGIKLDARSGAVQWRHSGPGSGGGSSVYPVRDGRLYLDEPATADSVVLDAGGGAMLGSFASWLAPAVSTEFLFASQPSSVNAVRVGDLQLAWTATTATFLAAPPMVAGGALLAPLINGEVEWRDAATGLLWWRLAASGPVESTGGIQLQPGIGVAHGRLAVPVVNRLAVYAWPAN